MVLPSSASGTGVRTHSTLADSTARQISRATAASGTWWTMSTLRAPITPTRSATPERLLCPMWTLYGEGPLTSTTAMFLLLHRESMIPNTSATTRCGGRSSVRTRWLETSRYRCSRDASKSR